MAVPDICPKTSRTRDPIAFSIERAIESNFIDYWLGFGECPGGETINTEHVRWIYSGTPYFNRVVTARLNHDSVDDQIQAIVRAFRKRKAAITWITGPSTQPFDLGQRLLHHRFSHVDDWVGMARDLRRLTPLHFGFPEAAIRTVNDTETLNDWLQVMRESFSFPEQVYPLLHHYFAGNRLTPESPWHHIVAYWEHQPVAASTVYMTGSVAGIYLVGTIPQARGRGFGTVLTWHALRKAKSLGGTTAVLHATRAGRNIYRQLGFREHCMFGVYRLPAPRSLWKQVAQRLLRRNRR